MVCVCVCVWHRPTYVTDLIHVRVKAGTDTTDRALARDKQQCGAYLLHTGLTTKQIDRGGSIEEGDGE